MQNSIGNDDSVLVIKLFIAIDQSYVSVHSLPQVQDAGMVSSPLLKIHRLSGACQTVANGSLQVADQFLITSGDVI